MVAVSGHTRLGAVIGSPVAHSLSPVIMNAAFAASGLDWVFVALDVSSEHASDAVAGIRALRMAGVSVTMPLKEPVASLVDRLAPDAELLGAVNCVVPEGDRLIGESTDGDGFIDALRDEVGFDPGGRRCVVLGAGGAARAVVLALGRAGAVEVGVANRSRERAVVAAALAGKAGRVVGSDSVSGADLVVNATPVGMFDRATPVDPGRLGSGQVVADLIYHPARTALLDAAGERGAVCVNGLGLLVHQAGRAFRLWTGEAPPLEAMKRAAGASLAERD